MLPVVVAIGLAGCGSTTAPTEACITPNNQGIGASFLEANRLDICTAASDVTRMQATSDVELNLDEVLLATIIDKYGSASAAIKMFPGGSSASAMWREEFDKALQSSGISLEGYRNNPTRREILTLAGLLHQWKYAFNPALTNAEVFAIWGLPPNPTQASTAKYQANLDEYRERLQNLGKAGYLIKDIDLRADTMTLPSAAAERRVKADTAPHKGTIQPFLGYFGSAPGTASSPSHTPASSPTQTPTSRPPQPFPTATQLCLLGSTDPAMNAKTVALDRTNYPPQEGITQKAICESSDPYTLQHVIGKSLSHEPLNTVWGVALMSREANGIVTLPDLQGLQGEGASVPFGDGKIVRSPYLQVPLDAISDETFAGRVFVTSSSHSIG